MKAKRKCYTFNNVSVSINAVSAEAAYDALCNEVLGRHMKGNNPTVADFETRTYTELNANAYQGQTTYPTSILFPRPGSGREK